MSKKSDKAANAAFLEKIKTLTIGTGAKPDSLCDNCGHPLSEHALVAAIAIPLSPRPKKQPAKPKEEETAFAA